MLPPPPCLFGCLLSRFNRLVFLFSVIVVFSLFSPVSSSPSVLRFSSSSGDVVICRFSSLSEVSWLSKSLASSSFSPSSLSVSVSAFLFCTFLSFPFKTSLRISFHWVYFPSTPLRQCLFFGVMVSPIFGARSVFLSL